MGELFKQFMGRVRSLIRTVIPPKQEATPQGKQELPRAIRGSAIEQLGHVELNRPIGDGFILFRLGNVEGRIYGGPYLSKPEDLFGVKMAAEIDRPCTVDIPTEDFHVPDTEDLKLGMIHAAILLKNYGRVYAGCWGGIGRTGLFMAAMAKMMETSELVDVPNKLEAQGLSPAVAYVRQHYKGHAVETRQQLQYLNDLDVSKVREIVLAL